MNLFLIPTAPVMLLRAGIFFLIFCCPLRQATERDPSARFRILPAAAASEQLTLVAAVVCEEVQDLSPQHPAVVFSISTAQVSCFSLFDPVPEKTHIYHNWYYRDRLTTRIKLLLKPPKWSTFSTIQLRESDIGPWRVEITDPTGKTINVLRFSVTE